VRIPVRIVCNKLPKSLPINELRLVRRLLYPGDMSKKPNKKLSLKKRPIRRLEDEQLDEVRGGNITFSYVATGGCPPPEPQPVYITDGCATGACKVNLTRYNHNQALRAR
jgi:hypothetical protein